MGHLHMRRQGLKSTKDKPPDTDLEEKITVNVVYYTTVEPSTSTQIYSEFSPSLQSGGGIHLCNVCV